MYAGGTIGPFYHANFNNNPQKYYTQISTNKDKIVKKPIEHEKWRVKVRILQILRTNLQMARATNLGFPYDNTLKTTRDDELHERTRSRECGIKSLKKGVKTFYFGPKIN